jgi:hypothetical protein
MGMEPVTENVTGQLTGRSRLADWSFDRSRDRSDEVQVPVIEVVPTLEG